MLSVILACDDPVSIRLPDSLAIDDVHRRHAEAEVVTRPLAVREWGERAFQFEAEGYRFMVAQEPP